MKKLLMFSLMLAMFIYSPVVLAQSGSSDGGKGGDPAEIEFINITEKLAHFLLTPEGASAFPEVNALDFGKKVSETIVRATDADLVDFCGKSKALLNYEELRLIRLNRKLWKETSPKDKYMVSFHEMLNLMGLELAACDENSYQISKRLDKFLQAFTDYNLIARQLVPEVDCNSSGTREEKFILKVDSDGKTTLTRIDHPAELQHLPNKGWVKPIYQYLEKRVPKESKAVVFITSLDLKSGTSFQKQIFPKDIQNGFELELAFGIPGNASTGLAQITELHWNYRTKEYDKKLYPYLKCSAKWTWVGIQ